MGGMLAVRYTLMYGYETAGFAIIDPIGLEDWQLLNVLYRLIDARYANELKVSCPGMKKYRQATHATLVTCPSWAGTGALRR